MRLGSLLKIRNRIHLGLAGGAIAREEMTSRNPDGVFIGAKGYVFEVY
jgi:hypothetical protein